MKESLLKLVLQLLLELICNVIEKATQHDEELQKEKAKLKKDIELAEYARKAYPSLSDDAIKKELC